jgi:hypothetical protein
MIKGSWKELSISTKSDINKKFWEELIAHLILHGPYKNHATNNSCIVIYVFIAALTFLPSRCLATHTYRCIDWWEGFRKYAVEMGSGAMIYVPSFIKPGSGIQKLVGIHRHKDRTEIAKAYCRKVRWKLIPLHGRSNSPTSLPPIGARLLSLGTMDPKPWKKTSVYA